MNEPEKKDFDFLVNMVLAEDIVIENHKKNYEIDYPKLVEIISENYQLYFPGYMPESQFVRKEEGKYYLKADSIDEAISYLFYNYMADIFKPDSRKLSGYNKLFSKLLIDFHLILKEKNDGRVCAQLYNYFKKYVIERREYQTELSLLLNGILNETIKQGDDITRYVKTTEVFKDTLIGYVLGKFCTYFNGVYYLNEVDLFSAEFGMLFYCGMPFTVILNQAEFLGKACQYYKIRQ